MLRDLSQEAPDGQPAQACCGTRKNSASRWRGVATTCARSMPGTCCYINALPRKQPVAAAGIDDAHGLAGHRREDRLMNKKVLLMAATTALLLIVAPRPAAKAMTAIVPALEHDSTHVAQVRGRSGAFGFRGHRIGRPHFGNHALRYHGFFRGHFSNGHRFFAHRRLFANNRGFVFRNNFFRNKHVSFRHPIFFNQHLAFGRGIFFKNHRFFNNHRRFFAHYRSFNNDRRFFAHQRFFTSPVFFAPHSIFSHHNLFHNNLGSFNNDSHGTTTATTAITPTAAAAPTSGRSSTVATSDGTPPRTRPAGIIRPEAHPRPSSGT